MSAPHNREGVVPVRDTTVRILSAIITRLVAELEATRLDRANLLAAMRATLAAHAEGERDPLFYLRDELNAHHRGRP